MTLQFHTQVQTFVHLIHSVDSFELLQEIDKQAQKHNRVIPCLIQFYIADEVTKFGFDLNEAIQMLCSEHFKVLQHVKVVGVMGMGTFTDNREQTRQEFKHLADIFKTLQEKYFKNDPDFKEISMGMTDDYQIAIEEGSTMIRIGSAIFGSR